MPQFADVRDLIRAVDGMSGVASSALAMNERGLMDALETPVDEIVNVVSATQAHSHANMRRSREEAIDLVHKTVRLAARSAHRPIVSVGVAMAFGCSISGEVLPDEVLRLSEACLEAGADIVSVADTVGFAGPKQIARLCHRMSELCGDRPYGVHLHDTRGMGLANAAAALDTGARVLDGSLGGLGGCPFAPGATGNVVFEDLVYLCETMGFRTGIDLEALSKVRAILEAEMPEERLYGSLSQAGPPKLVEWRA